MRSYAQQRHNSSGHTFFLFDGATDTLLGGLSLTRVTYGVSCSATLGYWMGVHHAGKGHMSRAVPALLSYAVQSLGLRRIEAASLPINTRSIHLLKKCGFQREGYAREYLEINGVCEDHILFAYLGR